MLFTREEMSADKKIREHYGYWLEQLYELGYVVMAFDPARAPRSQIQNASIVLKRFYEEHKEQHPQHTIKGKRTPKDASKLLRVLDAALVGINNKTIGDEIFGVEKYESQIAIGQERLEAARNYWRVM